MATNTDTHISRVILDTKEAKDKLKELQIAIKLKAAATAYASAIDKAYIATTNLRRAAMVALQAYMVICEKGRTKLLFHTMKLCVTAHKKLRITGRLLKHRQVSPRKYLMQLLMNATKWICLTKLSIPTPRQKLYMSARLKSTNRNWS